MFIQKINNDYYVSYLILSRFTGISTRKLKMVMGDPMIIKVPGNKTKNFYTLHKTIAGLKNCCLMGKPEAYDFLMNLRSEVAKLNLPVSIKLEGYNPYWNFNAWLDSLAPDTALLKEDSLTKFNQWIRFQTDLPYNVSRMYFSYLLKSAQQNYKNITVKPKKVEGKVRRLYIFNGTTSNARYARLKKTIEESLP